MMIDGIVKPNTCGTSHIVQECNDECERVEALKKWFQVVLTSEEDASIKGLAKELPPKVA